MKIRTLLSATNRLNNRWEFFGWHKVNLLLYLIEIHRYQCVVYTTKSEINQFKHATTISRVIKWITEKKLLHQKMLCFFGTRMEKNWNEEMSRESSLLCWTMIPIIVERPYVARYFDAQTIFVECMSALNFIYNLLFIITFGWGYYLLVLDVMSVVMFPLFVVCFSPKSSSFKCFDTFRSIPSFTSFLGFFSHEFFSVN